MLEHKESQFRTHIATTQLMFRECKQDPANLNALYTLIGHMGLVIDDLTLALFELDRTTQTELVRIGSTVTDQIGELTVKLDNVSDHVYKNTHQ